MSRPRAPRRVARPSRATRLRGPARRSFLDQRVEPGRRLLLRPGIFVVLAARGLRRTCRRRVGRVELGELSLDDRSQLAQVRTARFLELLELGVELPDLTPRRLEETIALGARLPQNQLRFPLGLLADLRAKLLRRDQRVVQCLVALTEGAELLVESLRFRVELLVRPRQALELFRDAVPKLLDAALVVAAQASRPEIMVLDVDG